MSGFPLGLMAGIPIGALAACVAALHRTYRGEIERDRAWDKRHQVGGSR